MEEKQTIQSQNQEPPQPQIIQPDVQNSINNNLNVVTGTTVVNDKPFVQLPISQSQIELTTNHKPSKWSYFFIILGVLQAMGVVLFFLIVALAIQQAREGASGTEFVGLILYVTLVPAVGIIAFINLIGLPIYIAKQKPKGKGLLFGVLSLLISFGLFFYAAYSVYQIRVAAPRHINELSSQYQQQFEEKEQQFATDNAKPEITKTYAIELLNACQLSGFYYTNQTKMDGGNWGELSSTGVVLTKVDGKPYRISIADRHVSELVPVAREAQKVCGGPQFWHDGRYEHRQTDGTWE